MPLTYLKVEPEQAVIALNKMIVSGYQLKDKLMSEYNSLPNRDAPKGLESIVPPDTRKRWTDELIAWTTDILQRLQDLYMSPAESYKFKEVQPLPMSSSEYDNRFYGQIIMLQERIDILNRYKDFIFQHTSIQIIAGRDANVQMGGTNNAQAVKNEG